MADKAPAGNDQPKTGEDQQPEATPEQDPNADKISALEAELKETNAAFTRYQQQQAQANQPVADEPEEVDLTGLTTEQIKAIQAASGAPELRKEIDALKKQQEDERKQRDAARLQQDMDKVAAEFTPEKGFPKLDPQTLGEHMQKTGIYNPRAAYKDLHESAIYDIQKKAAEPKATQGDRPDAEQKPSLSKEEYHKKLLEMTMAGDDEGRRKLMLEHGSVAPDSI